MRMSSLWKTFSWGERVGFKTMARGMECPPAPRKRRLDSDDDAFGKVALVFESGGSKVRRALLLPRMLDDESAPEEPASPLKGEPSHARATGKSPARPQMLRFASGDAASAWSLRTPQRAAAHPMSPRTSPDTVTAAFDTPSKHRDGGDATHGFVSLQSLLRTPTRRT